MTPVAILMIGAGAVLIYSGFTGIGVVAMFHAAFTGQPMPPRPGSAEEAAAVAQGIGNGLGGAAKIAQDTAAQPASAGK